MSDPFSFPSGSSSSVATRRNSCQAEDRVGKKERGVEGMERQEMTFLKDRDYCPMS